MDLVILPDGNVRAIYAEHINLGVFGRTTITRASRVEPNEQGHWMVDLNPVSGPVLGPFQKRSQALEAEHAWLEVNWLVGPA